MANIEMTVNSRGQITHFKIVEARSREEWPYTYDFKPKAQRGESLPKGFGLHRNRGLRVNIGTNASPKLVQRSERKGSGQLKHIGDNVWRVSAGKDELAKRFATLEASQPKK